MLQAIILCNLKANQCTKLEKIAKNLILDQILTNLTQIWAPNFSSWILPLLVVRHCYKISLYVIARKTNEPNLRKWQKPSFESRFGPHNFFSWILAILHVTHGCKLSLYANSRKTKEPNLKKWYSFGTDSGPFGPNLGPNFFFINVTSAMLGIVAGYHCMQFQEKLIKTKLEKMAKNLVPRPILAPLDQICPPPLPHPTPPHPKKKKNLLTDSTSTTRYTLLQVVIVCNFKEN